MLAQPTLLGHSDTVLAVSWDDLQAIRRRTMHRSAVDDVQEIILCVAAVDSLTVGFCDAALPTLGFSTCAR